MRESIAFVVSAWLLAGSVEAQEWTRFRGPNGSGISAATTVPISWSADDYNWTIRLPGVGHGSPVVWGEKLFVLCEEDDGAERIVVCVDTRTGREMWSRSFPSESHKKHKKNSFASSTPAVDEHHVYATWGTPERVTLVALTHAGQLVWEADLGGYRSGHGFGSSPIVHEDLVVLGLDQDGGGSLVALDRMNGEVRWRAPRRGKRATYSTPCVYRRAGHGDELIFTNWQHGITAVDPQSGRTNWELSVFDTTTNERAIGSPIVAGELVIGTCGFVNNPKHVVAVRPGNSAGSGGVREVYRIERLVPHIPTALAYEGRLYLWDDKGILSAYELESGRKLWQARIGGNYFGSPVCANGALYGMNDAGEVVVVATGDEYRELARIALGEPSHATPAVANGTMFLRTNSQLFSIGGD